MILSFGEMETNEELETNELINWMMRNDFKIIGLSFCSPKQLIFGFLSCDFKKIKSPPTENLNDKYV